jgi:uncharacterized protein
MKIRVERLTPTPTEFRSKADPGWLANTVIGPEAAPEALEEPVELHGHAHTLGMDLLFEGVAEGVLGLECSRCLARYRHDLREQFRLILEPAGDREPADPEAAEALSKDGICLGDEIEAGWYRGDEIDLESFFQEVVSLALPVKPLCDEECAGLCAHCGANLGEQDCGCGDVKPDSPFAVLAALKNEPGGSD